MNVSFSPNRIQTTDIGNPLISSVKKQKPMPVEVTRILQPEQQSHVPLKLTIRWKQNETANVSLPLTIRWKGSEDASLSERNMSQEEIKETLQELPSSKRKRIEDPALTHVAAKRPRVEVDQLKTISKLGEIEKKHGEEPETPNIRDTQFLDMMTTNALAQKKPLSQKVWTPEEDQKLLAGVKQHGHDWVLISQEYLGGTYTRRQCFLRYRRVIHPNRITGPWTEEEKQKLLTGVKKLGVGKWTEIAKKYFNWTRSDTDINKEYQEALDPELKFGRWTQEEDAKLIKYRTKGLKWTEIAELIGRTGSRCQTRFSKINKKIIC